MIRSVFTVSVWAFALGAAFPALGEEAAVAPAPAVASGPTFSGDVAKIVYKQCVECHRPDGGAPFSLITYDDVKKRARLIKEVTASGLMPPWKVVKSDLKFVNERHLPDAEKAVFAAWADAGAPLGDAAAVPQPPQFAAGWHHGTPDMVVEMEEDMPVPASGTDIYRAFVIRIPDLPAGKYLKGLEYRPRAMTTAHHTLFSIDSSGRARKQAEAQPGPGFRGGGGGGGGGGAMGRIAGWAVGGSPSIFPEGAALEIPPGSDLVLSSHFHPTGKPEVERSQIALYLTDEPPARYMSVMDVPFMFGALKNMRIPAGDPNYVVKEQFTMPADTMLAAIAPHAHYLAKTMHATATMPGGEVMTIVSIKDWDFAWQEQYALTKEVLLPKGTIIDMEFVYDNSASNPRNPTNPPKEVLWGLQSTDEMASITLDLVSPTKEARADLRRDYVAWVKKGVETADPRIVLASVATMNKDRLDLDGDGVVSWGEMGAMAGQIYKRIYPSASDKAVTRNAGVPDSADPRTQILPLILKRIFWIIILPWLLPRLAVFTVILVVLIYALRRWRASRRKRRAFAANEATLANETA